ncbi:hypothetical protein [Sphingopyxis sp. EG6]|uniref:hypothetical protein n=1 Tax=Sphingopyxis sp. EG6 TaxID=1874061 RepID=UPI000DC63CD5|nr:hypothetical protein [Sphingopyxis sp. EG6]BBB10638.1 hypothetical protein SPYCW_3654 [Sphingopyxis sp. EG6]
MKLLPINGDPCSLAARIENLDQEVRRIFPLGRLLDAVKNKEMALVRPRIWEDPREDAPSLCMLDGRGLTPAKGQRQLADYLAPAWAQCWSLNPGSDTLLRAYSRVRLDENRRNADRLNEGVTVTTTVRHLLAASEGWHAEGADAHVVAGGVEYLTDKEIWQRIVNACNGEHGPGFFQTVQGRAESLLWKRHYFAHEQEVRFMLISREWSQDQPVPDVRAMRIDPNMLFRSISFDPRLQPFEANERASELREAGYEGEIRPDLSYQGMLGLLEMKTEWPDP